MLETFDLWSFIGGLIGGGLIVHFINIRITKKQSTSGSGTTVDQSKSKVGGDQVGRDKRS